jgi:hypothetical protein
MSANTATPDSPAGAGSSPSSCSPSDLLPWVIAELRAKHAEAERLMIDRDPQQKHALNEFNIFAFNNVPFLADRCEALMKANTTLGESREVS